MVNEQPVRMLGYTPQEQTPPGSRHPPRTDPPETPPGADTPSPPREADSGIWSTTGRYASYLNAFLFMLNLCLRILWIFFFLMRKAVHSSFSQIASSTVLAFLPTTSFLLFLLSDLLLSFISFLENAN